MAPRKYPWEEWFGRPSTVLVRGVHYHCSQSSMCQAIRNNASRRRLRVHLSDTGTEIVIYVRAEEGQAVPTIRATLPSAQPADAGA